MARNPEVQISIDHISISRENGSVEARDVVISATGADSYEAAAAVHVQLAAVLGLPQDDEWHSEEDTSSDPDPR